VSAHISSVPVILLIENDEADVFLFRRALSKLNFAGDVHVVTSVSQARDYLEGRARFSDRRYFPLPDLIVSDMNLPGATGVVFLEWIRQQEKFVHIPFVFLSGTFMPLEQQHATTTLGVDSYFAKTGDITVMMERVQSMLKFLPQLPEGAADETPPEGTQN
jgi:CheY-like chemotaxis protein